MGTWVLLWLAWPLPTPWSAAVMSIVGAMALWFVLDRAVRAGIRRHLGEQIGSSLDALQSSHGTPGRWRNGILLALCVVVLASLFASRNLPIFVKQTQQAEMAAQQAKLLFQWWLNEAGDDHQRRTYPAHSWLLQQAEAGNTKAQITLAWQLLLGLGNEAQNLEVAGRWINASQNSSTQDRNWQLARAHWLVAQPVDEARHREAANIVNHRGWPEAYYLMALIELNPRSVLYDPSKGANDIRMAASMGHLRAAEIYVSMLERGKDKQLLNRWRGNVQKWKAELAEETS